MRGRCREPELEEGALLCVPRSLPAPTPCVGSISRLAAWVHTLTEGELAGRSRHRRTGSRGLFSRGRFSVGIQVLEAHHTILSCLPE